MGPRLFGTALTAVFKRYTMIYEEKYNLIIFRPQALSAIRKGTEMTATVTGWLIWAALCQPIFSILLWFFGFKTFYENMIHLKGISGLADSVFVYAIVVLAFYVIIRSWNFYNIWKFRGKERRVINSSVSFQDLERFFKLPPQTVKKIQMWKDITIDFRSGDRLLFKETAAKLIRFGPKAGITSFQH